MVRSSEMFPGTNSTKDRKIEPVFLVSDKARNTNRPIFFQKSK